MLVCKCIEKFRNNNGKIYGYRLIDLNNQTQDVTAENLKKAIASNNIKIINLKLTSDGRLIDSNEKQLKNNKLLGPDPHEIIIDKVAKALEFLDSELIDMGSYYEEEVQIICDQARIFDYNEYNSDPHEYAVKALKILIEINEYSFSACGDKYLDYAFMLKSHMLHYDVVNNKIVQAVELVTKYVEGLYKSDKVDIKTLEKFQELLHRVKCVDLEICKFAYNVANKYFIYLDDNYFFRSNSAWTIGGLNEHAYEHKEGCYTMHSELSKISNKIGKDVGYTIIFNRNTNNNIKVVKVTVKEYEKIRRQHFGFDLSNKDTGVEFVISTKNIETCAKKVANILNKLASIKYSDLIEN